jgi:catalase
MDAFDPPPPPPATPQSIISILYRKDGDRNMRPVHALGAVVEGFFMPSPVASKYCRAKIFDWKPEGHPALIRFSNGSGCARPHDDWSDVRGMATRFTLPHAGEEKEAYLDLIAMTLPEFFSSTPDEFQEFAWAARPAPYVAQSPWRKFLDMLQLMQPLRPPYPGETISPDLGAMAFADKNDKAKQAVADAALIGAPVSYLRAAYHAVHTFIVTGEKGIRRPVRFHWQPASGVRTLDMKTPYSPVQTMDSGDSYLASDLAATLISSQGKDHPRFSLMMTIGEVGDDLNDPSRAWPPHRTRIMMGTLSIHQMSGRSDAEQEALSFNPGLLTDGIEMSDDPVLKFRVETYKVSSSMRDGAGCPFPDAKAKKAKVHKEDP